MAAEYVSRASLDLVLRHVEGARDPLPGAHGHYVLPALRALAPHRTSIFGHIGDGNLHFNLLPPSGQDFEPFRAAAGDELTGSLHELVASLGGSFSAEHGVGVLKVAELERYETPVSLALMRTLKRALDPDGTMNPGKLLR